MSKTEDKILEAYSKGYDEGYKNGFSSAVEETLWECDDCGNKYDPLIAYCPNTQLHKANLGKHDE